MALFVVRAYEAASGGLESGDATIRIRFGARRWQRRGRRVSQGRAAGPWRPLATKALMEVGTVCQYGAPPALTTDCTPRPAIRTRAEGKPQLEAVRLGGLSMTVGGDCAVSVNGSDVAAGWLQVLSGIAGGSRTLGVPAGLTLKIAQPGANSTGACSAAGVPGLKLRAAETTSGFSAPCPGCYACFRQVLDYKCGSGAPLHVSVQAAAPGRRYATSPWAGGFLVTPVCVPGASACFGG
jgi:hypothetical protein